MLVHQRVYNWLDKKLNVCMYIYTMEIHVCAQDWPERIATVPLCMCEEFEIALGSHVLHPCQSHSPWWCWVAVTGCNHCTRRSQARTRRLCKGFLARNTEHGAVLCLQSPFLQTRTYMKSSATPFRFIWQPGRSTRDRTYVSHYFQEQS